MCVILCSICVVNMQHVCGMPQLCNVTPLYISRDSSFTRGAREQGGGLGGEGVEEEK